jgi:hypothetical protein
VFRKLLEPNLWLHGIPVTNSVPYYIAQAPIQHLKSYFSRHAVNTGTCRFFISEKRRIIIFKKDKNSTSGYQLTNILVKKALLQGVFPAIHSSLEEHRTNAQVKI